MQIPGQRFRNTNLEPCNGQPPLHRNGKIRTSYERWNGQHSLARGVLSTMEPSTHYYIPLSHWGQDVHGKFVFFVSAARLPPKDEEDVDDVHRLTLWFCVPRFEPAPEGKALPR